MTAVGKKQQARKRTEPRKVRRRQLILAAVDSISKRGFSATTLSHIAKGAKLSHGVVNYHFDSKEALYDETLGYLVREHYDLWFGYLRDAAPDPASQLAAIVDADFDKKVCTPKKLAVWFAFWGQAKYRPNYLKIHNRYDQQRSLEIERICRQMIADGDYAHQDATRVARTIEALIDGLWLNLMLYAPEATRQEARDDCYEALAEFFPHHFSGAGHAEPIRAVAPARPRLKA